MRATTVLVPVLLIAGCGGGDGRSEAVDVAESWLHAVEARDADAACALMAPSATAAIHRKYASRADEGNCANVVRVYGDAFEEDGLQSIIDGGLESEGAVKDEEIGVFPISGARELDVILMRRSGGRWKVASTSISPKADSRSRPAGRR